MAAAEAPVQVPHLPNSARPRRVGINRLKMGAIPAKVCGQSCGFSEAIVPLPQGQHGLQRVRRHPAHRLQGRVHEPVRQWLRVPEEPCREEHAQVDSQSKDLVALGLSWIHEELRRLAWRPKTKPAEALVHGYQ